MSYYYNIEDDLNAYPDAWCYLIIGGRNTGKTYSTLKYQHEHNKKFVFLKRTADDIKLLCAGSSKKEQYGVDLSPFKSINRDTGSNVKAFSVFNGLGAFWNCDSEDSRIGLPIGYAVALSSVSKVKGFDLSECDYIDFDEFIQQPWERVLNKKEGESVMDLYKTIARDREHRGRDPLKLIALANATSISNSLMEVLEVVDKVADMQAAGTDIYYDDERGIFIHIIMDNEEFKAVESQSKIYKAMQGTQWASMALENKFGYNDFTNVSKVNLKNYQPHCTVIYKQRTFYIYKKGQDYYMTTSRHSGTLVYDLNKENDQKRFHIEQVFDLRDACINGHMLFQSYTMYDLIVNYKNFFKV